MDDVPDVVSNSWGLVPYTHGYPPCDPLFNNVIDNLEIAGPVVVFAAGNEGAGGIRIPADRITSPVNTFAVGALNQDGTSIASFSSLGPSRCDNTTAKPEITAVGSDVLSSIPGGNYSRLSGTSMACPHVAGAVLLLRQINPAATAEEIKYALYQTAVDLGPSGDDNTFGMGRIDVVAAANALGADFGTIEGYVRKAGANLPIEGARVALDDTGYYGTTDTEGYYRIVAVAETTYDIIASAFGYKEKTQKVRLPKDTTVGVDFYLEVTEDGTLQGTVVDDSNGDPLENVAISFRNAPVDAVATDANGFYQTALPGDYAYDITAQKDDYDSEYADDIYVPEGGVVTQDFKLEPDPDRCLFLTAARDTAVEPDLQEYRKTRELISEKRPFGKKVLHLYREHTAEIAAILLRNPALRDAVRSMISIIAPTVQSIRKGVNLDQPVLSSEDEAAIYAILDDLEPWASPGLKTAIKAVRNDIKMLKDMKIGQVRSLLQ
jgi:hypothetical protein